MTGNQTSSQSRDSNGEIEPLPTASTQEVQSNPVAKKTLHFNSVDAGATFAVMLKTIKNDIRNSCLTIEDFDFEAFVEDRDGVKSD